MRPTETRIEAGTSTEQTAGSSVGDQAPLSTAENGLDTAMQMTAVVADRTVVEGNPVPVGKDEQDSNSVRSRGSLRVSRYTTLQDIFRLQSDIFLYPILICNVLKYSSNKIFASSASNVYEIAHLVVLVCMYVRSSGLPDPPHCLVCSSKIFKKELRQ